MIPAGLRGTAKRCSGCAAATLVTLALVLACGRAAERSLQERILEDLAYAVILPDLRELADAARALREAAERFRASPTESALEAVRDAWRAARSAWSRCQAHRVGPEVDLLLDSKIDAFPASEEQIEQAIRGVAPLDTAAIERLGANAKGFFGLELLLFDPPAEDGATLRAMTESHPGVRRGEMLVALAANLEAVTQQMRDLWEPERGGFARQLAEAGHRPSSLATCDAAFDLLVNRMVALAEWVADVHFVWPAGRGADPPEPHPERIRGRRAASSIQDASDEIEGLRHLYLGSKDGNGLGALVFQASPELDAAVRDAFAQASERIASIPPPLDRALTEAPDAVGLAFDAVKRLQVSLATDLVAVYQTTLRVVRFDGD